MSMAMAQRRSTRDRWIPWSFVAFFVSFITVDAVMVYLAVGSFSGVSTQNAYQEGLAYNETLAEARREKALGWTMDVGFAATGERQGRLSVTLLDRSGAPLHGATVTAELVRPTQEGLDFTVPLAGAGQSFAADLELPLSGQWEVRLVAARADATLHHRQRIIVH
jgi:nitrogen fixation protein FixH